MLRNLVSLILFVIRFVLPVLMRILIAVIQIVIYAVVTFSVGLPEASDRIVNYIMYIAIHKHGFPHGTKRDKVTKVVVKWFAYVSIIGSWVFTIFLTYQLVKWLLWG